MSIIHKMKVVHSIEIVLEEVAYINFSYKLRAIIDLPSLSTEQKAFLNDIYNKL